MAATRPHEGMLSRAMQVVSEKDLTNGGANDINSVEWTGLSAGITQMRLCFVNLASAATPGVPEILLGDATTGGYITSGYNGLVSDNLDQTALQSTNHPQISLTQAEVAISGVVMGGWIEFTLNQATTWVWESESHLVQPNVTPEHHMSVWWMTLAGVVDRVKLQSSKAAFWTNGRAVLLADVA